MPTYVAGPARPEVPARCEVVGGDDLGVLYSIKCICRIVYRYTWVYIRISKRSKANMIYSAHTILAHIMSYFTSYKILYTLYTTHIHCLIYIYYIVYTYATWPRPALPPGYGSSALCPHQNMYGLVGRTLPWLHPLRVYV